MGLEEDHYVLARKLMNSMKNTKKALNEVEDKMERDSYLFEFKDVSKQAKSYVYELSGFIDSAHIENKRILNKKNLL